MRKFYKSFVVSLCFLILFSLYGAAVNPTKSFYVNDYANVLTENLKQYIVSTSSTLYNKTGAQVVVLTVESLDNMDIKSYSLNIAREWGIGTKGKDNGILILLSKNDRTIRVEVGRGLEGRINDAKAGRLIREYASPYYSNGNYDEGTKKLFDSLVSEVYIEYDMEPLSGYKELPSEEKSSSSIWDIISAVITMIIIYLFLFRRRGLGLFINPFFGFGRHNHISHHNSHFGGGGGFGGGGANSNF